MDNGDIQHTSIDFKKSSNASLKTRNYSTRDKPNQKDFVEINNDMINLSIYDRLISQTREHLRKYRCDVSLRSPQRIIAKTSTSPIINRNQSHKIIVQSPKTNNNRLLLSPSPLISSQLTNTSSASIHTHNNPQSPIKVLKTHETNDKNHQHNYYKSLYESVKHDYKKTKRELINVKGNLNELSKKHGINEQLIQKTNNENEKILKRVSIMVGQTKEICMLFDEIKNYKNEIDKAHQLIVDEYKESYNQIEREIKTFENIMKNKDDALRKENETIKSELNKNIKENLRIKFELHNSKIKNTKLAQDNNDISEQYNDLNERYDNLSVQMEGILKTNKELLHKLDDMNKQNESLTNINSIQQNKIDKLVNEINTYKDKIDSLTESEYNLNEMIAINKTLEKDLIENKSNFEQLNVLYNQLMEQNEHNSQLIGNLLNENKKLKKDIEHSNESISSKGYNEKTYNDLISTNEQLSLQIQTQQEQIKELSSSLSSTQNFLKETQNELSNSNIKITSFQSKISNLTVENSSLKKQISQLENQLQLTTNEKNILSMRTNISSNEHNENLNDKITSLQNEIQSLKQENENLSLVHNENQTLKTINANLTSKLNSLNTNNPSHTLLDENKQLKSKVNELNLQVEKLTKENADWEKEYYSYLKQLEILKQHIDKLHTENGTINDLNHFKEVLIQKNEEIKSLSSQLKTYHMKSAFIIEGKSTLPQQQQVQCLINEINVLKQRIKELLTFNYRIDSFDDLIIILNSIMSIINEHKKKDKSFESDYNKLNNLLKIYSKNNDSICNSIIEDMYK